MNLLVLDTSTLHAVLAVGRTDGAVFTATGDPSRRHGRELIPMIRDLLRSADLRPRDLGGIGVGLGPGSFTGLRIGLAAAKTLAFAQGATLIGLDSLEAVARNAPAEALRVAVIADAQRDEVFAAEFHREISQGLLLRSRPTVILPQAVWLSNLAPETMVLGPGLERFGLVPDGLLRRDDASNRPDAHNLLAMTAEAQAAGRRDDPWFLEPVYLRRAAAEVQWDARPGPA